MKPFNNINNIYDQLENYLSQYSRLSTFLQIVHALVGSILFFAAVGVYTLLTNPAVAPVSAVTFYVIVFLFILITLLLAISREYLLQKQAWLMNKASRMRRLIYGQGYCNYPENDHHELQTS